MALQFVSPVLGREKRPGRVWVAHRAIEGDRQQLGGAARRIHLARKVAFADRERGAERQKLAEPAGGGLRACHRLDRLTRAHHG